MRDETQLLMRKSFLKLLAGKAEKGAHFHSQMQPNKPLKRIRTIRSFIATKNNPNASSSRQYIQLLKGNATNCDRPNDDIENSLQQILKEISGNNPPSDLLLLITPSSKHLNNHYKLHVINHHYQKHLGMTSITKEELHHIRTNKIFQKYSVIIATKYVDLKTVVKKMVSLLSNIKHCGVAPPPPPLTTSKHVICENKYTQCCLCHGENNVGQIQLYRKPEQHAVQIKQPKLSRTFRIDDKISNFSLLIENINNDMAPLQKELTQFFTIVDEYNFKIYIRPELCWRKRAASSELILLENECFEKKQMARFNIECFSIFDIYMGSITLNAAQIEEHLCRHENLLPRTKVISDVFEMIPLSKFLVKILRILSVGLGMEILYDAFGEYLFEMYK